MAGVELELAEMRNGRLCTELFISPDFNKTVVFTTTDSSYHGHRSNLPPGELGIP